MIQSIGNTKKFFDNDEKIYIEFCLQKSTQKHQHEFLELVYVTKGKAGHTIRGESKIISKGNYFIVDYNTAHEYFEADDEPFEIINCLFLPEIIDKTLKDCRSFSDVMESYMIHSSYKSISVNPADEIFYDSDGTVLEIIMKMTKEYQEKEIGYIELLRCMLIEIFIATARKIETEKTVVYDDIVRVVVDYVNENYMNKITLAEIANRVNYSLPYVSKVFKENYGMGFEAFLQKTRIEQSCRLLANSDKKIIDVAECVGYNDLKFFSTVFKRFVKMSPREYRRKSLL